MESTITLAATDSKGVKGLRTMTVIVWPRSLALKSLTGAPDRAGIHLVIMSDGFPPEQLGAFHDTVSKIREEMFRRPEIAAHREAWNIHVAEVVVLSDATGKALPNPLGTSVGCMGRENMLCFDDARVERLAARVLPHYTTGLLIFNSKEDAGTAGRSIAVITNDATAPETAVHELGHAFAGLDDEYGEGVAISPFNEDRSPNLTAYTDRERIPWRHWIEASTPLPTPAPGSPGPDTVGLFEGGGHRSNGVYRPTFESFMRRNLAPVGPVNGETWAREVYARGGAWQQVAPGTGTALARSARPAGGWVFRAEPLLKRPTAETRWFVNDVELPDERGASQVLVTAEGGVAVRVDLVDLTGRVRRDQGVVATLQWTVQ